MNSELVESKWLALAKWAGTPTEEDSSTYKGCTTTEFSSSKGEIYALLTVYNCDAYYGYPTFKRCEYRFKVKCKGQVYKKLCELVDGELYYIAKRKYEESLRKEENDIIQMFKFNITNSYLLGK